MDKRIQELIDFTKEKYGLQDYYLMRHGLSRNVNILHETSYTLWMEWFPRHISAEQVDEGINPEGTAAIEVDIHTGRFNSAIFVMGETYAKDGVTFAVVNEHSIKEWVEAETGLVYGEQFSLHKEMDGEFHFRASMDGIAIYPGGHIDVAVSKEGKLLSFSIHGHFPGKKMIKIESYTLSVENILPIAFEQFKLIELPSYEQNKLLPVYGVEEMFVENVGGACLPYEMNIESGTVRKMDQTIYWEEPSKENFNRKEVSWTEDISVEQASLQEPSPVTFPITKQEEEKCVTAVRELLQMEYPDDTGRWLLHTLQRDKGFILATLKANHQSSLVFIRKLTIMIDPESLEAANYMDNKPMLEMYSEFQAPDEITVTREEAFEKIKGLLECKPYYVYDLDQQQYRLCGKLDCHHGVNAATGEVGLLDEME